jgi:hypothetical protein
MDRLRFYYYWNPASLETRRPGREWLVSGSYWLMRLLMPAAVVLLFFFFDSIEQLISKPLSKIFLIPIGLYVIGYDSILSWRRASRERRAACDPNLKHLRSVWFHEIMIPNYLIIFSVMYALKTPFSSFFWVYIFLLPRISPSVRRLNTRGTAIEWDNTPLFSEITAIGERFGSNIESLRAKRLQKDGELSMYKLPLQVVLTDKRKRLTAIGAELFLLLEPEAISAAISLRWAREARPGSLAVLIRRNKFILLTYYVLMIGVILMVGRLLWKAFLPYLNSDLWTVVAACILFMGVPAFLFILVQTLIGFFPFGRKLFNSSYEAWQQAEKHHVRTPEEFILALEQYDALVNGITRPEIAILRMRRSSRIRRFLNDHGIEQGNEFWRLLSEKMRLILAQDPLDLIAGNVQVGEAAISGKQSIGEA